MRPRILVTGASGLIGRHVLSLLGGDAEVLAVSRTRPPSAGAHRWIGGDLARPGVIEAIVTAERPDSVIHLAGAVRGDRSLEAVGPTLQTNLVATVELLEAATRVGCRRIVLSGSLMEEPAVNGSIVPPSPYGASRWAASAYGRMFHRLFGAPVVILRPSFAYGPGQERTKLIPHVITALLEGESPELSSGERLLDCVYAADVARAYVEAASAPAGIEGMTLDLGRGEPTSVREIVETIAATVGETEGTPLFGALPVRPLEQQVTPDVERTARELGWRATTTLYDGLAATVAWFRERVGVPRSLI